MVFCGIVGSAENEQAGAVAMGKSSGRRRKREPCAWSAILVAILVASATAGIVRPAGAARPIKRPPPAHAARTLNATDTGHLHYVSSSGSLLLEEGSASGGLPGRMRARLDLGPTFSGSFTIYTRGGTIKGHGTATPRGSGRYESFAGSLVVTGGGGRYAHARGHAGLYGTFDRKTYALVIQTTGKLSF
jgi:hypothetical protein